MCHPSPNLLNLTSLYMGLNNLLLLKAFLLLSVYFNVSTFLMSSVRSEVSTYEACRPKTCGIGPNISYPFYVVNNETDFCGQRGFGIRCEEGRPIYRTSAADYLIRDISYDSQSFRLVNLDVVNDNCPNGNYSFDRSSVEFSPNHADVFFFYCCNSSFFANYTTVEVSQCGHNTTCKTYAGLVPRDEGLNWTSEACNSAVAAPIQLDDEEINTTILDIDYQRHLKEGFSLMWIGFGQNCAACRGSGGWCGLEEGVGVCYCPDGIHNYNCNDEKKKLALPLGLGLGLGVPFIMTLVAFVLLLRHKKKHGPEKLLSTSSNSDPSSKNDLEGGSVYFGVPVFSYSELEEATGNFSSENELGDGGFGTVYYGKLKDGRKVAVKRMYEHNFRRVEQFVTEIEILTKMRHRNLVSLYGCTSRQSKELLLVYEYIPNGTVADHLHGDRAKSDPLTWPIRLNIAVETASALAYLHASDIIHRDVKTNNILLDKNFCVKVADFGLSKLFPTDVTHVSTCPQGTPGYVDPEYHQCYQLTVKSDVYSFGVVLIELISSLPAVDITRDRSDINLANLAIKKIQKCELDELIDPNIGYKSNEEIKRMATAVAGLAFQCLQQEKDMRPTMADVLNELIQIQDGDSEKSLQEFQHMNDELKNRLPPPPPQERDEHALLKNICQQSSPISVTDKWISSSGSTTASVSG